ncbi:uncharacterized protein LOC110100503 [Dendrobium catenatum]|uniref:Avr9/Cf-9 rapidly elicited protein 146 n=1 Tax=Dendrobium catenatum TaxID=906689 RepID=A0A2I0X401_9ASPA|nr:uncharacterized protein LOC110100503 [Dendrobium catenatum]PKU82632.1 hypothetical protein MA16_Dca018790 [Dendrobium catenatum]
MELHSSVKAKQAWNFLRLAFFMMRKGLLSKRKFLSLEMNLIMKRGKLLGKNLGSLIANHHHSKNKHLSPASHISNGFHEYEFSCENSPNPVFFHMNTSRIRSYFPCISAAAGGEAEDQLRIECSPQCSYSTPGTLVNGERRRRPVLLSPYSVRVSNFSMEDGGYDGESYEVDKQAEEFIKRFYEQLKAQSPALLQLQDDER